MTLNRDILSMYQERACIQRSGNRASEKATVLTFERRDTAVGAKPTLAFSQIQLSRASFATGGGMSSHDSFSPSGNSPTRSDWLDFRSENHGSLFLLVSPHSARTLLGRRTPPRRCPVVRPRRSRRASVYLDHPRWYSGRRIGGVPWQKYVRRHRIGVGVAM